MPGVRVSNHEASSPSSLSENKTPHSLSQGSTASLRDQDAAFKITIWDKIAYLLENQIAADPYSRFRMLLVLSSISVFVLGFFWSYARQGSPDETYATGYEGLAESMWVAIQVLISAGYDSDIKTIQQVVVYFMMLLIGVTLVALLIGLISDTVRCIFILQKQTSNACVQVFSLLTLSSFECCSCSCILCGRSTIIWTAFLQAAQK